VLYDMPVEHITSKFRPVAGIFHELPQQIVFIVCKSAHPVGENLHCPSILGGRDLVGTVQTLLPITHPDCGIFD
jgi:hypothetical protein